MKFGVKSYRYYPEFEYFKDKADFIELMAIEGEDYSKFKDFGLPVVIHTQHGGFGINNANSSNYAKNKRSLDFAIKIADELGAKKIIVHPGDLTDENCSMEAAVSFLKGFNDNRIIIENLSHKVMLCTDPKNTREFLDKVGLGFCFDSNHAIEIAMHSKLKYLDVIREFLKLNPVHYHLGGQSYTGQTHLAFEDSQINIREIVSILPKGAEITLETSNDLEKTKRDLEFIKNLVKHI